MKIISAQVVFVGILLMANAMGYGETAPGAGQTPVLHIQADKSTAKVSPTLYGLMTEEINYSYDGGLYAELIRNRVFKGSETPRHKPSDEEANDLLHWTVARYDGGDGVISIDTTEPLNSALGNSLKLDAHALGEKQRVGIANDGYWGIPVRPNTTYRASFYARAGQGFTGPLTVAIESSDGATVFAQADVPEISADWKQYTVSLKTAEAPESANNRFVISTGKPGIIWFNLVSLFPPTFNDRPNGNRIDLMQMLVDMKPAFLRFPGGNYLEGDDLANFFDWKKTIGPLSERPTHLSPWGYRSSDGMGLLEFLEWTEDMHAQPVLAVFAGFTLRGSFVATGEKLKPFVQDALDEIEYVTGDKSTKWGAQRIADGHPEPFALNFVEVGNEDFLGGGPKTYDERFARFFDAIRAKYPKLQIIATAPVKSRVADLLDVHHYWNEATEPEMIAHSFDSMKRGATKIFVGEWATRMGGATTNLEAALGDAAWLTGMERNSDLVEISCFAPLFVNVDPGGMQWAGNLIGYDVLHSYGSPSYYVQKMFSNHIGDVVLNASIAPLPKIKATLTARRRKGDSRPAEVRSVEVEPLYFVVTKNSQTGQVFVKVVNITGAPQPLRIELGGTASVATEGRCIELSSADPHDTNSITEPKKVVPVESPLGGVAASFEHTFPPYSVTVLEVGIK